VKFDDQLAAFLYEHKILKLEGIGTFTLDSKVSVPHELEKEIFYPIEGLSFAYNPKSETDEAVIIYLVKKLHKIQPLVRSDLESYLSNVRQFINLGKPYTIEGIGTLSKNNQGTFEFTPGNFLPVKEELNPRRENAEHNYPVRSQSNAGKIFVVILIVIAALAALGGIGWGLSNLLSNRQEANDTEQQETALPAEDTSAATITSPPASNNTPPQVATTAAPSTDTVAYKMIFEVTYSRDRAVRRTTKLQSYNTRSLYDSLYVNNLMKYRLFLPVKIRPADTTRVKDSLRIFLGSRITVEKQ
jgi:hypothetical protein